MNKEKFIEQLSEKTNYSKDSCRKINDILEDNFLIGEKSKAKIIESFVEKLEINETDAETLYEICMDLLKNNLIDKIRHPFKSLD